MGLANGEQLGKEAVSLLLSFFDLVRLQGIIFSLDVARMIKLAKWEFQSEDRWQAYNSRFFISAFRYSGEISESGLASRASTEMGGTALVRHSDGTESSRTQRQ